MKSTLNFELINDKNVFQILTEPDKSEKKIVIMSHGFRGSSLGPARTFVDFERILVTKGFSVLRFDQLNSGNSEGDFLNSSFNEWIETIVYFAKKYIDLGYKVALFGQSMGATATTVASNNAAIKGKIPCILLWVPDAKTTIEENSDEIYEEAGQKYKGSFWQEARNSLFFECLESYQGGIHLVFGEEDRYVEKDLKQKTIEIVGTKEQPIMILKHQDHSPWDYDVVQKVYEAELDLLKKFL